MLPCMLPGQCYLCTLFHLLSTCTHVCKKLLLWVFFFFLTCFLNQSSVYTEYIEAGVPVSMVVHKQQWIFEDLRTTDSWSLQAMFYLCLHCAVLAAFDSALG